MSNILNKNDKDILNEQAEDIEVLIHDPYEMRPYFLVQTINDEQIIGFIEEYDVFSSKFLKVITPGGTNRKETYKYIPFSSVDYITPISKEAAISLISSMTAQPYDQYNNQANQLPPFNFELDFTLKQKWDSDKKVMIGKLAISLVLLVGVFVLTLKFPMLKEVALGSSLASILVLFSVIVDLKRSKLY